MRRFLFAMLAASFLVLCFAPLVVAAAVGEGNAEAGMGDAGLIAIGASIAMGSAAVGAGIAIASTGAAAVGATAEKPEIFGRVLIFVALAEALAIYGFLVAIFLWLILWTKIFG